MCGIVAAVARTNILPFLLEGLRRLEYRGYDSAGLAIAKEGKLECVRTLGRVSELTQKSSGLTGQIGIAHTRWATHGAPAERNAHPQICGELAVVHNGIIENYEELRKSLEVQGVKFSSQTDTEVVGHLIFSYVLQGSQLLAAAQKAMRQLDGTYALAVLSEKGEEVVLVRHGAPLLLGASDNGTYVASDAMALVGVTQNMMLLHDGDCARITAKGIEVFDAAGAPVTRPWLSTPAAEETVGLAGYRHFMQKEIFHQPQALAATLEGVASAHSLSLEMFGDGAPQALSACRRVLILACGTSFHAGLVARYWIEELAGVPCTVEVASEYRYRASVPDPATLVVAISQSGETADTLAAFRHAQKLGQTHALAICNVPTSSLIREAPLRFLTRAGPEIGVASTKAFTTQLAALFLLSLALAKVHKSLNAKEEAGWLKELRHVPQAMAAVLQAEEGIKIWAAEFSPCKHALFLGRGVHYPVALEGALKLKEISYIHAEAYPAGELKHGPLALVDGEMPVVAVAPNDALLVKLKGNLQEVQARGGRLYVLADAQSSVTNSEGCKVLRLPEHENRLSPIVHVAPLQLLAYHVAVLRGTDVDKPRNLAKSVTVE